MRSLTYSAIVGATFIFVAVVSALLWNYLYNSWSIEIAKQEILLEKFPELLKNNFSELIYSMRNISNVTINLDAYGLQYTSFYPDIKQSITRRLKVYGLQLVKLYLLGSDAWLEAGCLQNWSFVTDWIRLNALRLYRIYGLYLGKFPKLPKNLWNQNISENIHFDIGKVKQLKQDSLGFLGDSLLSELENEYSATLSGSNAYFYIDLHPEICDEIQTLSGVVISGDKFVSSNEVVVIKLEFKHLTKFSTYLDDPKACKKFLKKKFREILVNFAYSVNYNNYSEIIFPRRAEVQWIPVGEKEDYVLCDLDGHLLGRPEWLPDSVAKKICSHVNELTVQKIESSNEFKHLLRLPSSFSCSFSSSAFSRIADCLRVCGNAFGSIVSNALHSFYSAVASLFGGGGGPIEKLHNCISGCASDAASMACSACCRGSAQDFQRAEAYYSGCVSKCIDEFKQSVAAIKVKEKILSPGVNVTYEIVDTKLLINSHPVNLTSWELQRLYAIKSYAF
jgi:hypothetical protein